jgi:hypothetical protein
VAQCLSPDDAADACLDHCASQDGAWDATPGFGWEPQEFACAISEPEGSCTSWAPSSNITHASGTYYVDDTWIASTAADPAPLWTCDDAYVAAVAGGFQVGGASPGEALYELGLRNGDLIMSVNGFSLATYSGAMLAWGYLYWSGTTSYTLNINRSSVNMSLSYIII